MLPRIALALAVLLAGLAWPRHGAAQSPDDGAVSLRAAYLVLLRSYIDPLSPAGLLSEAWVGMSAALAAEGVSAPPLPPLPDEQNAAWRAFEPAFRSLEEAARHVATSRELAHAGIRAMAVARDECHTYFLPPDALREYVASLNGRQEYAGIGISRSHVAPNTVRRVFPDSPAERAGIRPGDVIVAVDGTPTADLTSNELNSRVRGPSGTEVTLRIQRPDGETVDVTLTRALVRVPLMTATVLPDGVGYIELNTFASSRETVDAVRAALEAFEAQDVYGWVLDLRFNSGGVFETLFDLLGLFLPQTDAVRVASRTGVEEVRQTRGRPLATQRPLAVLVGDGTVSAAEMAAAVLQDTGRARVFGEQTAGCGTLAELTVLPDSSGLVVATDRLLIGPSRRALHGVGVLPDEVVPAYVLPDTTLAAAAEYVKVTAAQAPDRAPERGMVPTAE